MFGFATFLTALAFFFVPPSQQLSCSQVLACSRTSKSWTAGQQPSKRSIKSSAWRNDQEVVLCFCPDAARHGRTVSAPVQSATRHSAENHPSPYHHRHLQHRVLLALQHRFNARKTPTFRRTSRHLAVTCSDATATVASFAVPRLNSCGIMTLSRLSRPLLGLTSRHFRQDPKENHPLELVAGCQFLSEALAPELVLRAFETGTSSPYESLGRNFLHF